MDVSQVMFDGVPDPSISHHGGDSQTFVLSFPLICESYHKEDSAPSSQQEGK